MQVSPQMASPSGHFNVPTLQGPPSFVPSQALLERMASAENRVRCEMEQLEASARSAAQQRYPSLAGASRREANCTSMSRTRLWRKIFSKDLAQLVDRKRTNTANLQNELCEQEKYQQRVKAKVAFLESQLLERRHQQQQPLQLPAFAHTTALQTPLNQPSCAPSAPLRRLSTESLTPDQEGLGAPPAHRQPPPLALAAVHPLAASASASASASAQLPLGGMGGVLDARRSRMCATTVNVPSADASHLAQQPAFRLSPALPTPSVSSPTTRRRARGGAPDPAQTSRNGIEMQRILSSVLNASANTRGYPPQPPGVNPISRNVVSPAKLRQEMDLFLTPPMPSVMPALVEQPGVDIENADFILDEMVVNELDGLAAACSTLEPDPLVLALDTGKDVQAEPHVDLGLDSEMQGLPPLFMQEEDELSGDMKGLFGVQTANAVQVGEADNVFREIMDCGFIGDAPEEPPFF